MSGTTIFSNVRLFDGESVHPSATVTVKDGLISSVSPSPTQHAGSTDHNVTTIDGAGRMLLPGLIDAHVHAHLRPGKGAEILKPAILCGITTLLDMHNNPEDVKRLKAECAKSAELPDLKSACYGATIDGGWPKPIVLHHDPSEEVSSCSQTPPSYLQRPACLI